jgi:glycerophosphoryl diester phosphodiesterase
MPAFALAIEQGADAIELDVRLSADREPVVLHDATLDRTTETRGRVGTYALAELMKLDAGARFTPDNGRTFPFRAASVRIPTLAEVLRAFPEVPFLVDIKEVAAQEPVRRVALEARAAERCVFASEHHSALDAFRSPPFRVAASGAEIGALYRAVLLRRLPAAVPYQALSVPERHRGLRIPTPRFVSAARSLGCPVHVWTANDAATARRLWGVGVAGIVTNYPDRIRAERRNLASD